MNELSKAIKRIRATAKNCENKDWFFNPASLLDALENLAKLTEGDQQAYISKPLIRSILENGLGVTPND